MKTACIPISFSPTLLLQVEVNKQKPYFKSTDAAITTGNASWNVVKDLAVKGCIYTGTITGYTAV